MSNMIYKSLINLPNKTTIERIHSLLRGILNKLWRTSIFVAIWAINLYSVLLWPLPSFLETKSPLCSLKFMFVTGKDPLCPAQRKWFTNYLENYTTVTNMTPSITFYIWKFKTWEIFKSFSEETNILFTMRKLLKVCNE